MPKRRVLGMVPDSRSVSQILAAETLFQGFRNGYGSPGL